MANDCISREAVLNTLDVMDKALDEDRTIESYKELLAECYKDLLPVTPKQRWIPVSERLPEEGVTVLITWNGYIDLGRYYEEHEWWWLAESSSDYWEEARDVVAWMPLPEPYKEGESE